MRKVKERNGVLFIVCVLLFGAVALPTVCGITESKGIQLDVNDNHPPENITIDGPTHGSAGTAYSYYANATDPEGDEVYYKFDWDDGSFSDWIGPYASGVPISDSHTWSQGSYNIRVKAKDVYGAESEWSVPFAISMPKDTHVQQTILLKLIERFSFLQNFLSSIS